MNEIKKLNLLPQEIKSKYENMYLMILISGILSIYILVAAVQLVNIGILKWDINRITAQNVKYEQEKAEINILHEKINEYNQYISEYERKPFPFVRFMHDFENVRPDSVSIISVDTPDRLINEGEHYENETEKSDNPKSPDNQQDEADTEENATAEEEPKIEYSGDITGRNIVIRGCGKNQNDISAFIYELSRLSYIKDAKVSAIEEHKMPDGEMYNIFEIVITGGTESEAVNKG